VESFGLLADQAAQPDRAKIHQLPVLDVAEVRGIGEHRIEASWRQIDGRSRRAMNTDVTPPIAVEPLPDPLTIDRNPDL